MIDKVWKYISENSLIEAGDTVIVSLSGGPDSSALLHILYEIRDELAIRICAFHLNHMLRGAESDSDEAFCTRTCMDINVELYAYREDIMEYSSIQKISVEAAGRERRYAILQNLCSQKHIDKIATAHNMNDNAESILMNMIRGTGLNGLCGIHAKRGNVIRPLLCVRKDEILQYLADRNIGFVIDSTNNGNGYPRNYIRHEIIPRIEEKFRTDFTGNINRMAGILSEDNDYLNNAAISLYNENAIKRDNMTLFNREFLSGIAPSLCSRIMRKAAEDLKGDIKDIEKVHISDITDLLKKRSGSGIDLPGRLRAGIEFDKIYIEKHSQDTDLDIYKSMTVKCGEKLFFNGKVFTFTVKGLCTIVNNKFKKNDSRICLDYDKIIPERLLLRHRLEKDRFAPYGRDVTKKLKKYFIEEQIPVKERSKFVLLALGDEIVWIAGYDLSDKYKVDDKTENVLVCEYCSLEET